MTTNKKVARHEIDRIRISKGDQEQKELLIEKGYVVHRKSNSTAIMVLWGAEKTLEDIQKERILTEERLAKSIQEEKERKRRCRAKCRLEEARVAKIVSIKNLWHLFKREKDAYLTTKKTTFYFSYKGFKIRVSDHEGCNYNTFSTNAEVFEKSKYEEGYDYNFDLRDLVHLGIPCGKDLKDYMISILDKELSSE